MIIDLFVHICLIHLTSIKCRPLRIQSHNTNNNIIYRKYDKNFCTLFKLVYNHNPYVCLEIIGIGIAPTPTFVSLGFLLSVFEPFIVD